MNLFDWSHAVPNPDLLGRFLLTADEIDPERMKAHEDKLRRAREYIAERGLTIKPLHHTKEK